MPKKYIIHNAIVFNVEEKSLSLLDNTVKKNKITLHAPTSECLRLLVENQGVIFSHELLLERVWKQKGTHVAPNTIYQNVSLLRRTFFLLGFGEEFIITTPRKGISFSSQIDVHNLSTSEDDPGATTEPPPSVANKPAPEEHTPDKPVTEPVRSPHWPVYLMIATFLCAGTLIAIKSELIHAPYYMDNYNLHAEPIKGCFIYRNNGVTADNIDDVLKLDQPSCKNRKHHYVSAYPGVKRYSIISCVRHINESNPDCISRLNIKEVI